MALTRPSKLISSDISGSFNKSAVSASFAKKGAVSGSLGTNATLIRGLTTGKISGSLGANASLIRSLTGAAISGSIVGGVSGSVASTGSFGSIYIDKNVNASSFVGDGSALSGIDIPTAAAISGSHTSGFEFDGSISGSAISTGSFGMLQVRSGSVTGGTITTTEDGKVGIGTASPSTNLHIKNKGHVFLSLDCDSGNGDLWQILSATNGQLELYNADTDKWALMSTSEGAFRLGSDMQFTEVAKGTISDASHASYEVAGPAVASDADGVWFLFRTTPSSDTYGTYAFYSADAGNTRMHAEIGNDSNGAVGWSGDNFTVSRNGAGTEDMVYVIYRLFDGAG
jgi:hypothetical protein